MLHWGTCSTGLSWSGDIQLGPAARGQGWCLPPDQISSSANLALDRAFTHWQQVLGALCCCWPIPGIWGKKLGEESIIYFHSDEMAFLWAICCCLSTGGVKDITECESISFSAIVNIYFSPCFPQFCCTDLVSREFFERLLPKLLSLNLSSSFWILDMHLLDKQMQSGRFDVYLTWTGFKWKNKTVASTPWFCVWFSH